MVAYPAGHSCTTLELGGAGLDSICVIREPIREYPNSDSKFRPSSIYPEYIFEEKADRHENRVYDMIRKGFEMLGLDEEHFGKREWNPLGKLIQPGDTVVLKPNMVLHTNGSECGTDCLYTHPSVVAAMVDYVLIAQKGLGKIVIGDAPVQECEFDKLIKQSGYDIICDFYKQKGIDIELVDFRNIKTYEKGGLHYLQEKESQNGCIVKLNKQSAFFNMEKEKIQKLRVTNYDPRILQKHHSEKVHEYSISPYVLQADVMINLPKPKTHRKAGVTISMKNLLGINTNKEFLPHHLLGSKEEGGDAYLHTNDLLTTANEVLDIKNRLIHDGEMELAENAENLYVAIYERGKKQTSEKYWEGSWHGNDTIWRTILDLNRIFFYADKDGEMTDKPQRKMFIVGDMIISGEKEGPLCPAPTYPGVIVMGDDPLKFDRAVCSLMGFDYHDIPTLYNDGDSNGWYPITSDGEIEIISNDKDWNGKNLGEIRDQYSLEFQPALGWAERLGNKYRDRLYKKLLENNSPVCIFGARNNGKYAFRELQAQGIQVKMFCDNDFRLWDQEIVNGIRCMGLQDIDKNLPFIIASREKYVMPIKKQIEDNGGIVCGVMNGVE